ncbi:heparinase II/III domain-containing protein [Viscerimonas tarda]
MRSINKVIVSLLLLIFFSPVYAQNTKQGDDTYFFSPEDIQNIKLSAKTDWGKVIIDSLKFQVDDRRKHSLVAPAHEAGHIHSFFCPVHNVYFDFDWESPEKHYCRFCDKYYSDERNNWAWIAELNNRNLTYLTASAYLYLATGEAKYAKYIKDMLLDYADKYPAYKVHDKGMTNVDFRNSAKMYAQSLDEAVWFTDACRAYGAIKSTLSKKEIQKLETQLFREAANLLLERPGGGNWQVWNNSGLAAVGVALNDDYIIKKAIEDPQRGYLRMMNNETNRDGWWSENSPNYHFFPFRAMALTADAVRCKGYNLFDEKLENMFLGPIYGIYPDMMLPSHNDGWYGVSLLDHVKLYETGYIRYKNPVFLKTLQACYGIIKRLEPEALLTNTDIKNSGEHFDLNSYILGQTGFGVLRSGKNSVVLKYGPSGGGHGHPDKLSITVHNGKSEIVPDLGTSAYGVPDYLKWYRKTLSHNTVTVDFKDQKPTTGELIYAEPTAMEVFTTKAYPGVEMRRSVSLNGNTIKDKFTCTSDSVHTYDYVLLFVELPKIEGAFQAATLNESEAYERIKDVKKAVLNKSFMLQTSTAKINFTVDSAAPFEVFIGEASGIPPTNPSMKTITGSEKRPVQPCYPLIIRTKDKNMKISSEWNIL